MSDIIKWVDNKIKKTKEEIAWAKAFHRVNKLAESLTDLQYLVDIKQELEDYKIFKSVWKRSIEEEY